MESILKASYLALIQRNMPIYGSPFLNLADDHTHSGPVDLYSSGGLVQLALIHSGQVEQ